MPLKGVSSASLQFKKFYTSGRVHPFPPPCLLKKGASRCAQSCRPHSACPCPQRWPWTTPPPPPSPPSSTRHCPKAQQQQQQQEQPAGAQRLQGPPQGPQAPRSARLHTVPRRQTGWWRSWACLCVALGGVWIVWTPSGRCRTSAGLWRIMCRCTTETPSGGLKQQSGQKSGRG